MSSNGLKKLGNGKIGVGCVDDLDLQAIKQMALRQEELEHEAEMARQLEAQKLWDHINSQSNSKPEPPSGIFRPNRIMQEAKSLPVSPEDMQM